VSAARQCEFRKEDGSRCGMKSNIAPGSAFCVWHDEERRQEAAAMRTKAGKRGGAKAKPRRAEVRVVNREDAPKPPKTLEDAVEWLSWLSWAVTTGTIDARTAHEAAYALRAFLEGRKAIDQTDERVRELQKKLKALAKVER
jgi:hypothetical protein